MNIYQTAIFVALTVTTVNAQQVQPTPEILCDITANKSDCNRNTTEHTALYISYNAENACHNVYIKHPNTHHIKQADTAPPITCVSAQSVKPLYHDDQIILKDKSSTPINIRAPSVFLPKLEVKDRI